MKGFDGEQKDGQQWERLCLAIDGLTVGAEAWLWGFRRLACFSPRVLLSRLFERRRQRVRLPTPETRVSSDSKQIRSIQSSLS